MSRILIKFFLLLLVTIFVFPLDGEAQTSFYAPKIIQRAEWGADESIFDWEAEYPTDGRVKKIILHDTGSKTLQADPDGSGFFKTKVKNIYRYHALNAPFEDGSNRRGFGDLGYHYLIDPNGNIYKGRKGENGVVGAQVFGFNTGYVGIALLGTYGSEIDGEYFEHSFTSRMQESLEKLVGWLAALNEINLLSQSQVCGKDKKNNQVCKTVYGLTTHKALAPSQDPGKIIDQEMPVVFIATRDESYDKIVSNIQEVKARKGRVIAIVTKGDTLLPKLAEFVIEVPVTHQALMPIVSAVRPRNIFPSKFSMYSDLQ